MRGPAVAVGRTEIDRLVDLGTVCAVSADLGGAADGRDDVLVPRAAAQVARDRLAGLLGGGVGVVLEVGGDRRDEPGGAEPALQGVALGEGLLHRAEVLGVVADALDRRHLVALRADGEHQARAHRLPVDEHGARPAHAVLAADVGAGEAEVVAQEVRQQAAGGGGCRARHPVDAQADVQQLLGGCVGRLLAHATDSWAVVDAGSAAGVGWVAVARARRVSSAASIRR
jgi:hypothetical protein